MRRTKWYPGTIKPVREGWYERNYNNVSSVPEVIHKDLWQQFKPGDGFWYVDEPEGQINDAFYENLPWRGVLK